jgi:H+/Cl- antiporter ClcA
MATANNMLAVGAGFLWLMLGLVLEYVAFGPYFSIVIPIFKQATPAKYWTMLGGDMFVWIPVFVCTIGILAGFLAFIRVAAEVARDTQYEG